MPTVSFSVFICLSGLPDAHDKLHHKAHSNNAYPAGESHEDWFGAGLDQFYKIGVQTDGSHRHDDHEFA